MPTAASLWKFLGKGSCLPKVTLPLQRWLSSNDCYTQGYKASPYLLPMRCHARYCWRATPASDPFMRLVEHFVAATLQVKFSLCPVLLPWVSERDCFLKHSLIFLGLHFLQNQAIDRRCQEKEAAPKNGILEMNYSLAIDNENPFTGIGVILIVSGMR